MDSEKNLPFEYSGDERNALKNATTLLQRALKNALADISVDALDLNSNKRHKLATVLADFSYDLQNGIGLWSALELYNREFFNTPLPFIVKKNQKMGAPLINTYRLHYLLWYQYEHLKPDLIISPTHKGLHELAKKLTLFINQHIHLKVKKSSIKHFLDSENDYGWDVKKKLLWLGQSSFLFRNEYQKYVQDHGGEPDIGVIDDFMCQETTIWSGLGVIDILARILDITDSQKSELRSWYERHVSVYKIVRVTNDVQIAANIVTGDNYSIRTNVIIPEMPAGSFVYGSLVPWNGEWHWSGVQHVLGQKLYADYIQELISDFRKKSTIVYRYAKDLLEQAQKNTEKYYADFVEHFGDELVVFSDGHKMAAAIQNMNTTPFRQNSQQAPLETQNQHEWENTWGRFNPSPNVLENDNGIGLFFEKSTGTQMMLFFNHVQSGLEKRGVFLNDNEIEALRGFITSPNISPAFVKKVTTGQKIRSIKEAFLLRSGDDDLVLNFLFRKYKGDFFRNYYPNVSVR